MTNFTGASVEDQIIKTIEKNSNDISQIQKDIQKIKRYIVLRTVLGIVYFVIIIAPIIFGIIYLPNILESFTQNYLGLPVGSTQGSFNEVINDYLK